MNEPERSWNEPLTISKFQAATLIKKQISLTIELSVST